MIVHSERNLDLDWMLTHLETMKMTGGKMSDNLFDDVYDLVKECKRQKSKNKKNKRNEIFQNSTGYVIDEVSGIDLHVKAHKTDDVDSIRSIKICVNGIKKSMIEHILREWDNNAPKTIIMVNDTTMGIYSD